MKSGKLLIVIYLVTQSVSIFFSDATLEILLSQNNYSNVQYIASRNSSPVNIPDFDVELWTVDDDGVDASFKSTRIVGSNGIDTSTKRQRNSELS